MARRNGDPASCAGAHKGYMRQLRAQVGQKTTAILTPLSITTKMGYLGSPSSRSAPSGGYTSSRSTLSTHQAHIIYVGFRARRVPTSIFSRTCVLPLSWQCAMKRQQSVLRTNQPMLSRNPSIISCHVKGMDNTIFNVRVRSPAFGVKAAQCYM